MSIDMRFMRNKNGNEWDAHLKTIQNEISESETEKYSIYKNGGIKYIYKIFRLFITYIQINKK